MKHTIQEKEGIEFIKSIQKRAMAKYSQATVWGLDGFQENLGNLLYETIEDALTSQLQSIQTAVSILKMEALKYPMKIKKNDRDILNLDNYNAGYNKAIKDVQSIISNRIGEK